MLIFLVDLIVKFMNLTFIYINNIYIYIYIFLLKIRIKNSVSLEEMRRVTLIEACSCTASCGAAVGVLGGFNSAKVSMGDVDRMYVYMSTVCTVYVFTCMPLPWF